MKACDFLKKAGIEWIDGELFSDEISFEKIQGIIGRSKNVNPNEARTIKYNVFDYISQDEWTARWSWMVRSIHKDMEYVKLVPASLIEPKEINEYHDYFVSQGHEGIIIRLPDYKYEQKRTNGLLKYKSFIDEEFKIIGIDSEENNPNKLGAMVMRTKDGKEFRARPKASEEEKAYIFANQKEYIGKMGTIKYQNLTKEGVPRFGIFLRLRNKKL